MKKTKFSGLSYEFVIRKGIIAAKKAARSAFLLPNILEQKTKTERQRSEEKRGRMNLESENMLMPESNDNSARRMW